MEHVSQNHSKHLLMVHLIFSCKYRKKLLIKYGNEIKQILYDVAEEKDLNIIEMEVDKDHIHILVQYPPTKSVLDIVRLFKQISTYKIWRQNNNHIHLKKQFWLEKTFWGDGYFACSRNNRKIYTKSRIKAIHPLP